MYYFSVIATFRFVSGIDQEIKIIESNKKLTEEGFLTRVLDDLEMDQVKELAKLSVRQLVQVPNGEIEHALPDFGKKSDRSFFLFDPDWDDSDDTYKWIVFKDKYEYCRFIKQRAQENGAIASRTRGNIKKQIEQEERSQREMEQFENDE